MSASDITVVVGLKSPLLLRGVQATLSETEDLSVLDTALDAAATLGAIEACQPRVALLDVRFHREDGGFIGAIGDVSPDTRLVFMIDHEESKCFLFAQQARPASDAMVGMYLEKDCCLAALRDGGGGCCWSESPPERLLAAIRRVVAGEVAADRWLEAKARHRIRTELGPHRGSEELTPRQQEITRLVAAGLSNHEIADRLGLAEQTVKNHTTRAMRVLGARNRVELACSYGRTLGFPLDEGIEPPSEERD